MSIAAPHRITPEELLEMPERDHLELLDGILVEKNISEESSWVGSEILYHLRHALTAQPVGWVFGEGAGYRCFGDSERVRRPDVSFILRHRRPQGPLSAGYTELVPDLVVEVVSPNDLAYAVNANVEDWLAAGVPEVWVVMPRDRSLTVYRPDQQPLVLQRNEEITLAAIPAFRCEVSQFFPPRQA